MALVDSDVLTRILCKRAAFDFLDILDAACSSSLKLYILLYIRTMAKTSQHQVVKE